MIITEKQISNKKSTYIVENENEIYEINTDYLYYTVDGVNYRTIVRTDATIIETLGEYVNQKYDRDNTKISFMRDIMKFYQFLDCMKLDEKEFLEDTRNYIKLAYFLAKKNVNFTEFKLNFLTTVKNVSASRALTSIKTYISNCLKINCTDFEIYKPKAVINTSHSSQTEMEKHLGKKCLSEDELRLILYAAKKTSLFVYAMVLLLCNTGMRIGTALGITEEDLKLETENGQISYHLLVRNRKSNKPYQMVKNLSVPLDYDSEPEYFDYNITALCFEKLQELIKENHKNSKKSEYKKEKYNTEATADLICNYSSIPYKENHYVFLTKRCQRMTVVNWNNNYLIPLFKETGIDLNRFGHCKNHIFRHSFIKHMQNKANLTIEGVKHLLRDKSYSSAQVYMGNRPEDIAFIEEQHNQFLLETLSSKNYELYEDINDETTYDEGGLLEYADEF